MIDRGDIEVLKVWHRGHRLLDDNTKIRLLEFGHSQELDLHASLVVLSLYICIINTEASVSFCRTTGSLESVNSGLKRSGVVHTSESASTVPQRALVSRIGISNWGSRGVAGE